VAAAGAHYDFTDPLGETSDGTRRRIRHAHALIYGMAAPSLLLALLADGGPVAQRLATGVAALATGLMAAVKLLWRRPPARFLLAGFPLAGLTVTAVALFDPPRALTPMYYVWPLLTAAYFLQRREVLCTYAVVCGSFAAIAPWAVTQGPPLVHGVTVAVVGSVVVAFVGMLKDRLDKVVGRLRVMSRIVDLTGALNRRALVERIDGEITLARQTGASCALAVLDVDHFKTINDRYGHAAGHAALRRLVTRAGCNKIAVDFGDCRPSGEGHDPPDPVAQQPVNALHTGPAAGGEPVRGTAPDDQRIGAERERRDHVGASPHAAVEGHLHIAAG
jgi:Diguanylate cyclase, GGDEF domain